MSVLLGVREPGWDRLIPYGCVGYVNVGYVVRVCREGVTWAAFGLSVLHRRRSAAPSWLGSRAGHVAPRTASWAEAFGMTEYS